MATIPSGTKFLGVDPAFTDLTEKKGSKVDRKSEYFTIADIAEEIGPGPTGPQGVQGPAGPQGALGPVGPAGLEWRGAWVSGTSYVADDAVGYGGASYFCISATSGTTTPNLDTTKWALLAAQGAQGQTGATGAQGPQGPAGPSGTNAYKSYIAKITHGSGTSAPTASVLYNTIGESLIWQYEETGSYSVKSNSGLFTVGKTIAFATSPAYPLMKVGTSVSNSSALYVGLTTENDSFLNLFFEIRVYN